jgi:hypothetical protein
VSCADTVERRITTRPSCVETTSRLLISAEKLGGNGTRVGSGEAADD